MAGLSEYSMNFSRSFNPTAAIISLTDNWLFAIAVIKRIICSLSICNGLSELVGVEITVFLRALTTIKRFLSSLSVFMLLRKIDS